MSAIPDEQPSLEAVCASFYAAQQRIKALNSEREELRTSTGFAATILRDAVLAVSQQQKKFGEFTVHVDDSYDVFCKGCGTFATSCNCDGGPTEVHAIYRPRIWLSKKGT